MACETYQRPKQTLAERKDEIRRVQERVIAGLKSGKITAKVDAKGGVTFNGIPAEDRPGITDACIYRRVIVSGSQLAIQAIQKAERLAGRAVDKQIVATGYHSHDGGTSWHRH
jgi:hypothetical protein